MFEKTNTIAIADYESAVSALDIPDFLPWMRHFLVGIEEIEILRIADPIRGYTVEDSLGLELPARTKGYIVGRCGRFMFLDPRYLTNLKVGDIHSKITRSGDYWYWLLLATEIGDEVPFPTVARTVRMANYRTTVNGGQSFWRVDFPHFVQTT